jgi:hypothetical protein
MGQQKWLLGFYTAPAMAKFLANKIWIQVACHEKGANVGIGKCIVRHNPRISQAD